MQFPLAELQDPVVHKSVGVHVTGVYTQVPSAELQVSVVQRLPSSHVTLVVYWHPNFKSQESVVHALLSEHVILVPKHPLLVVQVRGNEQASCVQVPVHTQVPGDAHPHKALQESPHKFPVGQVRKAKSGTAVVIK